MHYIWNFKQKNLQHQKFRHKKKLTFRWQSTGGEWITNVASVTDTVGYMVDHRALGVHTTLGTRTGVNTVQILTGQCRRTLGVCRTFWSACNIRIAKVLWDALTCGGAGARVADCVLAARRWVARVDRLRQLWSCYKDKRKVNF